MATDGPSDRRDRRASGTSQDKEIFYMDDLPTTDNRQRSTGEFYAAAESSYTSYPSSSDCCFSENDEIPRTLDPTSCDNFHATVVDYDLPLHLANLVKVPRLIDSTCGSRRGTLKRSNSKFNVESRANRRSSAQCTRSRANSACRSTPLGDSRRTSVCRKGRTRRMSSATRRKSSLHPTKIEANDGPKVPKNDERNDEQARRHRRVAMIVFATFLFLLAASILVVVVTLTHSSFHSPPTGSRELSKHRAQLRKENEELFNSLNRDSFVPENTTTPP